MSKSIIAGVAALLAVGALAAAATFQEPKKDQKPAESRPATAKVHAPFFGNEKCPISGEAVDRKFSAELDGQLVYFCCGKCKGKAAEGTKENAKKLAEKAYPTDKVIDLKNENCPVMGEKVGDSKATTVVMGRKIHLCCDDCAPDVKKAPIAFLALATNPKLTDVGNTKCPISGKEVSANDVVIYKDKVVRMCCPKCADGFEKDADKSLAEAEKSARKTEKKH
jgi:YHS domain-containing protein